MQPLGNKILVRDITEKEKVTESGIVLMGKDHYRKVLVESVSPDSVLKFFDNDGNVQMLFKGDVCLANPGGVELEKGLWLCNENLLDCKL